MSKPIMVAMPDLRYGDLIIDHDGETIAEVHFVRSSKDVWSADCKILNGERKGRQCLITGSAAKVLEVKERGPGRERLDLGEWWPDGYEPKKRKKRKKK